MAPVAAASSGDAADTQRELVKLVQLSPTLTAVVERDPSLLADQEYVGRVNPELEQFLQGHPEVGRNPDFYLFSDLQPGRGREQVALERKVPGQSERRYEYTRPQFFERAVLPFLVFLCGLAAVLWLIYVLLQNRRWSRASRLQMEAHGKLMERFGNNQELLAYMSSEAGRKFLEAAPIPVDMEAGQRLPNAVSRVLLSMQIGGVLTLLGCGLMVVRHALPEANAQLLVTGIVFLMPGLGFLISAVVTWMIAARLNLLPVVDNGRQR